MHEVSVRVTLRAARLDWVARVVLGLGLRFVVESPEELRAEVGRLAQQALDSCR